MNLRNILKSGDIVHLKLNRLHRNKEIQATVISATEKMVELYDEFGSRKKFGLVRDIAKVEDLKGNVLLDTCECPEDVEENGGLCDACGYIEDVLANSDFEEEESRVEDLLKKLPDGDYSPAELEEYLS